MATANRKRQQPRRSELQAKSASPTTARRLNLLAWALCCLIAGAVFVIYISASRAAGEGCPVMPLDDVYIHFQYAHQIAVGQPYRYNADQPPTSGATSFLYPYLLAIGDLLGFRGLELGTWAMALGAVAFALSLWAVFTTARWLADQLGGAKWIAWIMLVLFGANGAMQWHFMSGMETGLAVLFTLWTVRGLVLERDRETLAAASLLALTRPEGAVIAALAPLTLLARRYSTGTGKFIPRLRAAFTPALFIPVLAIGVQPLVNLALTGSFTASGSAAKSLFGIIPPDTGLILTRIWDNFTRMWREIIVINPSQIFSGVLILFVAVGITSLVWRRRAWPLAAFLVATLILLTLLVSTLDTAFWHFKRYQMPIFPLLFILAAAGVLTLAQLNRYRGAFFLALFLIPEIIADVRTSADYLINYRLNTAYVAAQPLQMAEWLRANTPEETRVAVHDAGLIRYLSGRETLDMVGLTTPDAAASWRNGPGAVGEWLQRVRPDLIASYGAEHGYGLGYLQDTDLYAETLAQYTVALDPARNVALAADTQGIYRPAWKTAENAATLHTIEQVTPYLRGMTLMATVDVADLTSERDADYRWQSAGDAGGFATEYRQMNTIGCEGDACLLMDGGRRLNGEEQFTIAATPGDDLILITRLHPQSAGSYLVYANGVQVAERVIPALPGSWLEIPVLIPREQVAEQTTIRIVPQAGTSYQPYTHWVYSGQHPDEMPSGETAATFQNGAIVLFNPIIEQEGSQLRLNLTWATPGNATGDYRIFVHLLNPDGSIAAQADVRPGANSLPPGNWIAGAFTETLTVDLANVTPGEYALTLGLYDPLTNVRLVPAGESDIADTDQNRVSFGMIMVEPTS